FFWLGGQPGPFAATMLTQIGVVIPPPASFDQLVGEQQEWLRNRQAKRFRRLEIDPQSKRRWLYDRQVGRLFAAQNASDIDTGLPVQVEGVRTVADEAAAARKGLVCHHRGQSVLRSQSDDLRLTAVIEQGVDMDQHRVGTLVQSPTKCGS